MQNKDSNVKDTGAENENSQESVNEQNEKSTINEIPGEEQTDKSIENTEEQANEESSELDELEKMVAENKELKDKYLRLYSDFENYKRRTNKERLELFKTAGEDVLKSLLPVLDDFDRAEKAFETSSDAKALTDGVKLVSHKLKSTLSQKGLNAYETIGKEFDADMHEAIVKTAAPSKDLKGKVIDEIEKGYMLNDKVIRFAKVVIGE
ncbi:MAG: nucleotide exchange factor GrpE [Flavobacteriales bacterium]|nr:nucleotide exchange factor GrpE [Flavobacteriales bacterium]